MYGTNCSKTCECDIGGIMCDHVTGCVCSAGWTGSNCEQDIDECTSYTDICMGSNSECRNSMGSYVCECQTGFSKNSSGHCEDINECEESHCEQVCQNTDGSFLCSCNNGYSLHDDKLSCSACTGITYGSNCSKTCECDIGAIMCDHITGCVCTTGWTGSNCEQDIDECTSYTDICMGSNSECRNSMGSYVCECQTGFSKNASGHCEDINECEYQDMNSCEQRCNNVLGSYSCSCRAGYTQSIENPYLCTDIDECSLGISGCQQVCENLPGRFNCLCYPGYVLDQDRKTCRKVEDICAEAGVKCDHICISESNVTTHCTCNRGYKLLDDNTTCTDINECAYDSSLNTCNNHDGCINNNGSYECRCAIGHKLQNDRRTCLACDAYHYGVDCINECRCGPIQHCNSVAGCLCRTGWEGENCNVDIDECSRSLSLCNRANTICDNIPGHYQCVCKVGYFRSNHTGECRACSGNTYGKECSEKCICIVENVQVSSQVCHHVDGSCLCKPQWTGSSCREDVNECQNGNTCNNKENSECFNTAGGYTCQCQTGYTEKDGKCVNDTEPKSDGTQLRFDLQFSLYFVIIYIISF